MKLIKKLQKICSFINKFIEYLVGFAVFVIVFIFLFEIFLRFFSLGHARWGLEVNRILFSLIGFLGASAAYFNGRHIRFDFIEVKFKDNYSLLFIVKLIVNISIFVFSVIMIKEGVSYSLSQVNTFFPTLRISRVWFYMFLPISGVLIAVYSILTIAEYIFTFMAESGLRKAGKNMKMDIK